MRKLLCALLAAATLSGCATRGTLDSDCASMATVRLERSQLVRDIQSGGELSAKSFRFETVDVDPRPVDSSVRTLAQTLRDAAASAPGEARDSLLLSGGGQWGAYGAGFLAALEARGDLPRFATVTGVSTGALQALFIGALGDPAIADKPEARADVLRQLMQAYRPENEKDVVFRHNRKELAVITGSFAGLSPLRERIQSRLCDDAWKPTACAVILHLARSKTKVLVGFVKASDGHFYYADINQLAQRAYPGGDERRATPQSLGAAQRCITGAALASVAMPVFFQQVRVGAKGAEETYYDGGVRQSVFEGNVAGDMHQAYVAALSVRRAEMQTQKIQSEPAIDAPTLYVIRNGPTVLISPPTGPDTGAENPDPGTDFNRKRNAIDAAMRAEAILVNQLEVGSIADLRLAHPTGPIKLRTADGFGLDHKQPGDDPKLPGLAHYVEKPGEEAGCKKDPKEAMFSPSFMACIMRYGRQHGTDAKWIPLSPVAADAAATTTTNVREPAK